MGFLLQRNTGTKRRAVAGALFVLSAVLGAGALAACDTGGSASGASGGATQGTGTITTAGSGQVIFTRYCQQCHPGGNQGVGPSLIEEGAHLNDDQIKNTVRNGRGRMPAIGTDAISDNDLSVLVAYIRTLK